MSTTPDILSSFESGLNMKDLSKSTIPAVLIGFGEISTILKIQGLEQWVIKRLPLFPSFTEAKNYQKKYHDYCNLLIEAGIQLPNHESYVIKKNDKIFCLYILQESFPDQSICHRIIHNDNNGDFTFLQDIIEAFNLLAAYNAQNHGEIELAIDGQLSNWAYHNNQLFYIDTSTPIFRRKGKEQLDPIYFLKSAPAPFRIIIKLLFLKDVMNRYYDSKLICIDLLANLYKEKKSDLIAQFRSKMLKKIRPKIEITEKEIFDYYKEDKLIWTIFLRARKIDRWVKRNILRIEYPYLLPNKIDR